MEERYRGEGKINGGGNGRRGEETGKEEGGKDRTEEVNGGIWRRGRKKRGGRARTNYSISPPSAQSAGTVQ